MITITGFWLALSILNFIYSLACSKGYGPCLEDHVTIDDC